MYKNIQYVGKDGRLLSSPRATPGNDFCARAEVSMEDFWFESSLLLTTQSIYTWEESNVFFAFHRCYLISKRRVLSESLHPVRSLSSKAREKERMGERGEIRDERKKEKKREKLIVSHTFSLPSCKNTRRIRK